MNNRFVEYKPTSLEKNYKHEMLTEVDLGVNIDLIDPDTYALDPNGKEIMMMIVMLMMMIMLIVLMMLMMMIMLMMLMLMVMVIILNPLSPNIHIQILQTDLYTFPLRIS